jgi:hypothetical protein
MKVWGLALATVVAAGCTQSAPEDRKPKQAEPLSPVRVVARMAAMEAASATGNRDETRRQMAGFQDEIRQAMRLPNPSQRIDPESARSVVKAMPGVHSVAWLDRDNLLVIVGDNALRSQKTIDAICLRLEPLGDTLGVIVNLKTRAARRPEERGTLSRNCQLAPGEVALFQKKRKDYDPPPEVVAAFRASQKPQSDEDRKAQREAQRILEASTPEM